MGRVVETGTTEELYGHPPHPYTQALLSASPGRATAVDLADDVLPEAAVRGRGVGPTRDGGGLPLPHPLSQGA
jgi:ABC-type glutathione transport system ATPase component